MESYNVNLGKLIKEKRLQNKISTQELARSLDVSVGFINNIENAKTDIFNINLIYRLCKILDMSPLNFLPESNINMDFDNIYDGKYINYPETNKELIMKNVTAITAAYLESIKNYNYDVEFIDKFTKKLLSEINYVNGFKLG